LNGYHILTDPLRYLTTGDQLQFLSQINCLITVDALQRGGCEGVCTICAQYLVDAFEQAIKVFALRLRKEPSSHLNGIRRRPTGADPDVCVLFKNLKYRVRVQLRPDQVHTRTCWLTYDFCEHAVHRFKIH
jgi:hypothetical protein